MALPKNICLAPFIFNTINPQGNQSPCPTLGGDHWDFGDIPLKDRWMSSDVENFRQLMLDNQQLPVCVRCWSEEAVGGYSLRKQIYDPNLDPDGVQTQFFGTVITPKTAIKENFYRNGPMQLVMKVNNVCNLRCRSCNAMDSVAYKVEGQRYEQKYNIQEPIYTRGPDATYWTDEQLDEIFSFSKNLRRLELYGGEPLLDKQTPKLLKKLVESGLSKKIELNISTNVTIIPDAEWIEIVSNFKQFNLSLSIDGVGAHFEYLRHPAKWAEVTKNIDFFHHTVRKQLHERGNYSVLPVITVSTLNIYYLPELITELRNRFGSMPHLNLVRKPWFYRIDNIPDRVKQAIIDKFNQYNIPELEVYVKFMQTPMDPSLWKAFSFWTMAKDEYRQENFSSTFPEFYKLIKSIDPDFYTKKYTL